MAKTRKRPSAASASPRDGMFAHANEMRPKIGRPSFRPSETDRRFVSRMSAVGMSQDEISAIIGIDRNTLVKHFRDDIDGGRLQANAVVSGALFRHATGPTTGAAVRAAEIWLRARAGWVYAETDEEKKRKGEGQTFVLKVERD